MTEMHLTGFDAVELLGYGSGGEVWLARERATGLPVALKRLRAGADLAARDRLRREAAVLAGVDHPHVVRLRSVHGDGDALVLVLDLAAGGSLARLLATRRRLRSGRGGHHRGAARAGARRRARAGAGARRRHAGQRPVRRRRAPAAQRPRRRPPARHRSRRGRRHPRLPRPGGAGRRGARARPPTCTVWPPPAWPRSPASRRTTSRATGSSLPTAPTRALCAALEAALAPDPADRPTAEELAVAVFDAAAAEPVRFDRRGVEPGEALVHRPVTGPVVAPPTHQVRTGPRAAEEPAAAASRRRRGLRSPVAAAARQGRGRGRVRGGGADPGRGHRHRVGRCRRGARAAGLGGSAPTRSSQPAASPATTRQAPVRRRSRRRQCLPATDWASTLRRARPGPLGGVRPRRPGGAAGGLRARGSGTGARTSRSWRRLTGAGLRAEGLRLAATVGRRGGPIGGTGCAWRSPT